MSVALIKFRRPSEVRFWSHVDKSGDCWEWTISLTNKGYGQFQTGHGIVNAHRMAWHFTHGEIPIGQCVLHRCDNRKCARPDHLFLGTIADNNADMRAKGRQRGNCSRRGETEIATEAISAIRELAGKVSQREIARLTGISQSHVGRILRYERPFN